MQNNSPPVVGVDILIYDAGLFSEEECVEVVMRAAELSVLVLLRNFATRFGWMGRNSLTTDITSYLNYQLKCGRPDPTCQVQGKRNTAEKWDYKRLIQHFKTPQDLSGIHINMLDNPLESDPT